MVGMRQGLQGHAVSLSSRHPAELTLTLPVHCRFAMPIQYRPRYLENCWSFLTNGHGDNVAQFGIRAVVVTCFLFVDGEML